jgi:sigma-E factor negative regulatory protein RseC
MIEEQAQVIEVKGEQLVLQAQTQSACGSCAASQGCGTSLLSKVVGRKFTRFQAKNNVNAIVGDTVIVGIPEDALLKGSVVMYVIPVIGMLVLALFCDVFFSDYLLKTSAQSRDLMIAVSAIMGLVLGSLISRWYFQRQSSAQLFSPVVLRKIIDHGKL